MKALQYLIAAGSLGLALPAVAGDGYLGIVGPVPLRLGVKAEPRASVAVVLPPLDPPQPAPPVSEPPKPIQEPPKSDPPESAFFGPPRPGEMVEVLGPPAPEPPVSGLAPAGPSSAERGAITAALLKFFQPGGANNSTGKTVLVPVGFAPPQPVIAPSSSASYSTSP
ncbi:MAG: hypothetical protein EXS31_15655 [Pedosphaera sp.]|nr:hypothetical protein [Pedosphaera sp.]